LQSSLKRLTFRDVVLGFKYFKKLLKIIEINFDYVNKKAVSLQSVLKDGEFIEEW